MSQRKLTSVKFSMNLLLKESSYNLFSHLSLIGSSDVGLLAPSNAELYQDDHVCIATHVGIRGIMRRKWHPIGASLLHLLSLSTSSFVTS